MLKSSTPYILFPLNLTASFLMIALLMLPTNALFLSAIEDNSMLTDRFTLPRMMTSPLFKFRNLTNNNWLWLILMGLCLMITFCLVPFMPLVILRECTFFHTFLGVSPNVENYSGPSVMLLPFWSIIHRVMEGNSLFLSCLYWSVTGSRHANSSEPVT